MKIHTLTIERWNDDGTRDILIDEGYEYSGLLALAGNKSAASSGLKNVGQTQQNVANTDIANQAAANTAYQGALNTINNPQSSPLYASDYASGLENVANTYGNLRQQGFKLLGATGFGNSPSGQESSMLNNINNQQGQAETQAYRNALNQAEQQGTTEAGLSQGQENIYNPNAPLSGASNTYNSLSKVPSWQQSLGTGLVDAASIAAAPFTGGASLVGLGVGNQISGGSAGGGGGFSSLFGGGGTDSAATYGGSVANPSDSALFGSGGTLTPGTLPTSTSSIAPAVASASPVSGLAQLFGQQTPTGNYRPASSTKANQAQAGA